MQDVSYIAKNLTHEFMHLMEHRLVEYENTSENSYLSYWNNLIPSVYQEDAYAHRYTTASGTTLSDNTYTADWWNAMIDTTKVFFIDARSEERRVGKEC